MNKKIRKLIQSHLLTILAVALVVPWSVATADDLNIPTYRGGPLSVSAQWNYIPGSTILNLTNWSSVGNSDPTTYLYPNFTPTSQITPNNGIYQFQLPNWVDNMPIKYLRLQLAWGGTTASPINIFSQGLDGVNPVVANLVFTSTPQILTSGVYQYFDFTFGPNPDFERVNVQLPANNYLTQAVVDTVSTVPEPATLVMLGLGALSLIRHRRRTVV
jgi:hypothetical protein